MLLQFRTTGLKKPVEQVEEDLLKSASYFTCLVLGSVPAVVLHHRARPRHLLLLLHLRGSGSSSLQAVSKRGEPHAGPLEPRAPGTIGDLQQSGTGSGGGASD